MCILFKKEQTKFHLCQLPGVLKLRISETQILLGLNSLLELSPAVANRLFSSSILGRELFKPSVALVLRFFFLLKCLWRAPTILSGSRSRLSGFESKFSDSSKSELRELLLQLLKSRPEVCDKTSQFLRARPTRKKRDKNIYF